MSTIRIPLPPRYRPDWALSYQGRDRQSPAERVEGNTLSKVLEVQGAALGLHIALEDGAAAVDCDVPGFPDIAERTTRRMLGLLHDPGPLEARAASEPDVARLLAGREGLRFPLSATVFEGLCWAIVGQQVNLTFAATLRRTLIELVGLPHRNGGIAHPTPERVAGLSPDLLTVRKFSRSKADYLIGVARHIAEGRLDIEGLPELSAEEAEGRLTGIRGIGPWTRQYVLMRSCGFPDCVPAADAGLAAALQRFHRWDRRPTPAEQVALMQPFAPYRSHATACLWASLSD